MFGRINEKSSTQNAEDGCQRGSVVSINADGGTEIDKDLRKNWETGNEDDGGNLQDDWKKRLGVRLGQILERLERGPNLLYISDKDYILKMTASMDVGIELNMIKG